MPRCSKLHARARGSSRIINEIGENVYNLELPEVYDILPTFNVKDLRSYHDEDLRASIFFPTMRD